MNERYFDHAASTPCDPQVLVEMLPYFTEAFANPNSIHSFGKRADAAVRRAREQIATAIGAEDPSEIFFTSGATEGNNQVLRGFSRVAISAVEHSSIWETAHVLGYRQFEPGGDYDLVSIMAVNNETGFILPKPEVGSARLHRDMTQAVGKVPFELPDIGTFSGHKIYGPKGIGVTYVKDAKAVVPLLVGGGQERGLRAGTLNVTGIVGMGIATELAMERQPAAYAHAESLRHAVLHELEAASDWAVNAPGSPFVLSVGFAGIMGESMVLEADAAGFGISSGSACTAGKGEHGHVLKNLGVTDTYRWGSVRISFGRDNTEESARELGRTLVHAVEKLRNLGKRATF